MKKLMILLTAILLIAVGCVEENAEIKAAVTKYDTLLAEGYKTLNMNPLIQAATGERANKAFVHMEALGRAGIRMNSKLGNIKFTDIKIVSPDQADVDTEEFWEYTYNDIDSGKSLFENKITYQLQYKLIKKTDRWLVSGITIKKAAEEKESGHIFRRPKRQATHADTRESLSKKPVL